MAGVQGRQCFLLNPPAAACKAAPSRPALLVETLQPSPGSPSPTPTLPLGQWRVRGPLRTQVQRLSLPPRLIQAGARRLHLLPPGLPRPGEAPAGGWLVAGGAWWVGAMGCLLDFRLPAANSAQLGLVHMTPTCPTLICRLWRRAAVSGRSSGSASSLHTRPA